MCPTSELVVVEYEIESATQRDGVRERDKRLVAVVTGSVTRLVWEEFLERLKNSKTEEQYDVTKVLAKAQRTLTGFRYMYSISEIRTKIIKKTGNSTWTGKSTLFV